MALFVVFLRRSLGFEPRTATFGGSPVSNTLYSVRREPETRTLMLFTALVSKTSVSTKFHQFPILSGIQESNLAPMVPGHRSYR